MDAEAQFALAVQASLLGHNDAARKHYEDALHAFQLAQDLKGEANVHRRLGDFERKLERNDEARRRYDDARRIFETLGDRLGEAYTLLALAHLDREQGHNDVARKSYDSAMRLFLALQERAGESEVLLGLGHLERTLGRTDEARKSFASAMLLYRGEQNSKGEANALLGLGFLERKLRHSDAARRCFEQALPLYRTAQDRLGEANLLYGFGEVEHESGRNEDARKHFRDALLLYQSLQNRLGESNVLTSLGDLEAKAGRVDEARQHYTEARILCRAGQNRLGEANACCGLGDVERTVGRYDYARTQYDCARQLYKGEQNPLGEGNVLVGVGHLERKVGRETEARKSFRDAAICYGLADMPKYQSQAKALAIRRLVLNWASLCVATTVVLAAFVWIRTSSPNSVHPSQTIRADVGKRWFNFGESTATAVVFVHGILSSPSGFRFDDKTIWPQLLLDDPRANKPNMYLGQYYTSPEAGIFDIPAASEELRVQLNLSTNDGKPAPLKSEQIVFIAHSTGGLVVRDLLTRNPELFKGKRIGLALIASPSRGSDWASRLEMVIDVANNRMARQLQKGNEWTDDLDKRFVEFVHKSDEARGFSIKGIDLFENRFIAGNYPALRLFIPTRSVVVSERDSASYFGAGKIVPDTDHFSIAKPSSLDHASHRYLMEWWVRCGW